MYSLRESSRIGDGPGSMGRASQSTPGGSDVVPPEPVPAPPAPDDEPAEPAEPASAAPAPATLPPTPVALPVPLSGAETVE